MRKNRLRAAFSMSRLLLLIHVIARLAESVINSQHHVMGVILFFVLFVALHQNKLCNINRLGIA